MKNDIIGHKFYSTRGYDFLKIFIDGDLHLCINLDKVVSVDSWFESSLFSKEYFIYIGFTDNGTTLSYIKKEAWLKILKIINEHV